jgi:hypothetical protein
LFRSWVKLMQSPSPSPILLRVLLKVLFCTEFDQQAP